MIHLEYILEYISIVDFELVNNGWELPCLNIELQFCKQVYGVLYVANCFFIDAADLLCY